MNRKTQVSLTRTILKEQKDAFAPCVPVCVTEGFCLHGGLLRDFNLINSPLCCFANGFPTAWVMNCLKVFTVQANIHHSDIQKQTHALMHTHTHSSMPAVLTTCIHANTWTLHRHTLLYMHIFCFDVRCYNKKERF